MTAPTGPDAAADAVDTERAPVVSIQVEGDQVPAEPAVDQSAGFGVPLRSASVSGDVGEAGPKGVAAGARERRQDVGVDHRSAYRDGRGGGAERVDLPPQSIGQYLLELGQGANRRLLDTGDGAGGGTAQPHRYRYRLGVIEQEGRKAAAAAEAVAARDAAGGVHRVAKRAELVDVTANRPRSDLQPAGQLLAGPVPAKLQQREQGEQAGGGLERSFFHRLLLRSRTGTSRKVSLN